MKTTNQLSPRVGLSIVALLLVLQTIRSSTPIKSNFIWPEWSMKFNQLADVTFASIPEVWCEDDLLSLPAASDEGEAGTWSPSQDIDVSGLGGTTITVTFTPTNTNFNAISFDIDIESPPYLGIDQAEPLMFCKTGGDIFVDLVDTLGLQLSNIMTLQGDGQLFSFISENSFNPSAFETELRNLNLKDIPSGPYTFFVESGAINSCLFTTKSFSLEVLEIIAGEDDTLNICYGNQRFHDFDELLNSNTTGTWEERAGSNSGINISSPSSVDLSTTPIGSYTFDYITIGTGPCTGYSDTATLLVNIQNNSEVTLTDLSVSICGKDNLSELNVELEGRAPYEFIVQLRDDQGNLFPSYVVNTNQNNYVFQVAHTTGTTRIENGTIYLNQASTFYDLLPISLQDANSDQCFEQELTGSTRIDFEFVELEINKTICTAAEFIFLGETFSINRPFGSVIKHGLCDTIYNINLSFDEIPIINVSEEICENESIMLYGETFSVNNLNSSIQVPTPGGCDTIYNVSISLRDRSISSVDYNLCPGEFVEIGNTFYDINNNNGTEVLTASNGCDSVVHITITEKDPVYAEISNLNCEGNIELILCEGDTIEVENELFTIDRPVGTVVLVNFAGCDSIINVNLIYSSPVTEEYSESLCAGDVRTIGNVEFSIDNPSGTVTLIGANGCDSIINVNLKYGSNSTKDFQQGICDGESYDFGNGIILDANNLTFTENLLTPEGCDSIINYSVVVYQTYSDDYQESVCDGDFRTIGNQTFDANNPSGIVNLTTIDGCDSIIIVDLTILALSTTLIEESLCGAEEIQVGGQTFNKANPNGVVTMTNAAGCDSIINVNLEINEIQSSVVEEMICEGETYDFGNGVILGSNNTSESLILTSAKGCDSMVSYSVIINPTFEIEINDIICEGETLTIGADIFDINRTSGIVTLSTSSGCDSIINVDIIVLENSETLIQEAYCGQEEVNVGGQTFNEVNPSGIINLTNANGCDSTVTVDLSFGKVITVNIMLDICEGESYDFGNGVVLDENNTTANRTYSSILGCDSIVSYGVNINSPTVNDYEVIICEGSSTIIEGVVFNEVRTNETFILINSNGCDSILNVNVSIAPRSQVTIDTLLCTGESITVAGTVHTSNYSGTIRLFGQNHMGCDSFIHITLGFHDQIPGPDVVETICVGDEVVIGGETFNANRLSGQVIINNPFGCDTIVFVDLTLEEEISTTINDIICKGVSIDINGETYDQNNLSGLTILTASSGCDSSVFVNLVLQEDISSEINQTICKGASYDINGTTYSQSNLSGQSILTTSEGCDSTVFVNLILLEDITSEINQSICKGSSVDINGTIYSQSNLSGQSILTTSEGCDSTVFVNLILLEDITSEINQSICKGSSVDINGTTYSQSNLSGQSILTTSEGCDSTVFVNLTLLEDITSEINQSICKGASVDINGTIYSQSNLSGQSILTTSEGCDSTVFVNLILLEDITSEINQSICKGASVNINGTTYSQSNLSGQSILTTSEGCDSTVFVNLTLLEDKTSIRNEVICDGDFMDIHGERFDVNRLSAEILLSTSEGCDSTVFVSIEIAQNYTIEKDTTICASEFGTGVNSASVIRDTFTMQTVHGCDSLFILNVYLLESASSSYEATLCSDEFVEIGNEIFDINNPVGTAILVSHLGCDSVVSVDLTYITATEQNITSTLCEGEEILVNNISYNVNNPTGLEIIGLSNGCDSIIIVDLTFKNNSSTLFNDILCEDESIIVNNITYDINTPRGTQTLSSANGCDSIIEIDLSFSIPENTIISQHLCIDEEIMVEGVTFNASNPQGDIVLQNAIGCDSVITVDLTFTDIEIDVVGRSVCPDDPSGGSIFINTIIDGMAPYTYVINGTQGDIIHEFPMQISNLSPGQYDIEILDAEGCSNQRTVTITDAQRMDLNIDYTEAGEGVYDLELQHTGTIDSFYWMTTAELSCADCMRPSVTITETVIVSAVVIDENGCSRQVDLKIEYERNVNTKVANIIHPNSNIGNNRLYLTLEDPTNLTYDIYVFSRWGEVMYKAVNLEPNNSAMGWEGTRAGKRLNTGVYIYEIMIKENNVLLEVIHGDVTLID